MDLAAALSFLDEHTNLERMVASPRSAPPTLDRIRRISELTNDPHLHYPVIHVTGTNGKTSTARMIAALLQEKGLSVGLYTSPHLERINERLVWDGAPIDDDAFVDVIAALAQLEPMLDDRPTYFELLTAAAFRWFADVAVDAAVIEVGLGGTWDATNIVEPSFSVVTTIGLDHTEFLGPTRRHVAAEKAGIVKPSGHLVLGENDPDLRELFVERNPSGLSVREEDYGCERNSLAFGGRLLDIRTPGAAYTEVFLAVHGAHQGDNAATALTAAEAFFAAPIEHEVVEHTFASVRMPGRLEVVGHQPVILLDGVKNPEGAAASAATLEEEFPSAARVVVVGLLKGRDPAEVLSALEVDRARLVITCPAPSPRTVSATELSAVATMLGAKAQPAPSVAAAVEQALLVAQPDELVLITGSLYVVGEARSLLVGGR